MPCMRFWCRVFDSFLDGDPCPVISPRKENFTVSWIPPISGIPPISVRHEDTRQKSWKFIRRSSGGFSVALFNRLFSIQAECINERRYRGWSCDKRVSRALEFHGEGKLAKWDYAELARWIASVSRTHQAQYLTFKVICDWQTYRSPSVHVPLQFRRGWPGSFP